MEKKQLGIFQRIGEEMAGELDEILAEIGKGRKEVSITKIFSMIPKHNLWEKIKEDLINHDYKE